MFEALHFLLVAVIECKKMYKSLRDAARYQQKKKIGGKSGDSGDELGLDEENVDERASVLDDGLACLTPTATRIPRKTTSFGNLFGENSQEGNSSQFGSVDSPATNADEVESNYSYVRDLFIAR